MTSQMIKYLVIIAWHNMMHATYSTHKVSLLCYLHQQFINFGTVLATNCHKYNHMSYIILSLSTCQYAIANLLPNMNLQSIEIIIYYIFLRNRSHKYLWQVPGSCEPLTQICNYLCLSEIWICRSQYPQVFTRINSQVPMGLWYSCPPLHCSSSRHPLDSPLPLHTPLPHSPPP